MPVTMICPNLTCRRPVVAADAARGKIVRCAYCNQPFMVPTKVVVPDETPDKNAKQKKPNRA